MDGNDENLAISCRSRFIKLDNLAADWWALHKLGNFLVKGKLCWNDGAENGECNDNKDSEDSNFEFGSRTDVVLEKGRGHYIDYK